MLRDDVLFSHIEFFINEIYPHVNEVLQKRYIKPSFDKYPRIDWQENGMPHLVYSSLEAPIDIQKLFNSWSGDPDISLTSFESYNRLFEYLYNHNQFRLSEINHYLDAELQNDFFKLNVQSFIKDILGRYYLLNKSNQTEKNLLKSIYIQAENYIYEEKLSFDITVPILFIRFDFEEYIIDKNIALRRIKDEYHKARLSVRSYSPSSLDPVISSATHELVLYNYEIKKDNKHYIGSLDSESAYPIEKLELFFNALKIISNYNSGFAQILVYPHNWADFFRMDLPRLKGISVKKYPSYFDDFYWNNTSYPIINLEEMQQISNVYLKLLENSNNRITISNKRLRNSYLRDNDEDSIIDIIIAIETLLCDQEKGEITYKLAMRMAKLISKYNQNYKAQEIFQVIKKIYAYRSAIVHGSNQLSTKREITLHETSKPISIVLLANDYLREVIKTILLYPQYLNSKELDKLLLE